MLCGCKTKKLIIMKAISLIYVCMLFICVIVGGIATLMWKYSLCWGISVLFLIPCVCIPLVELKDRVKKHPNFSTILFVLSFAILVVFVVRVTLLMKIETFLSVMCTVSLWLALLMTMWFVSFIPRK